MKKKIKKDIFIKSAARLTEMTNLKHRETLGASQNRNSYSPQGKREKIC